MDTREIVIMLVSGVIPLIILCVSQYLSAKAAREYKEYLIKKTLAELIRKAKETKGEV